jgi:electron transport complex protein RnfG
MARSPWIQQFAGTSLDHPVSAHWKVRKDGGSFDYVTGATVTPRAIVKAVQGALTYFAAHRSELLSGAQP